mmetsp:Transcript_44421/g.100240  ORF Transcript_44421/g.100240 Transcript_44421/m.100240 type:complete len:200 (-) Transcript_44421:1-600(-)
MPLPAQRPARVPPGGVGSGFKSRFTPAGRGPAEAKDSQACVRDTVGCPAQALPPGRPRGHPGRSQAPYLRAYGARQDGCGRLRTYVRSDGRPVGGRPWAWSPRAGGVGGRWLHDPVRSCRWGVLVRVGCRAALPPGRARGHPGRSQAPYLRAYGVRPDGGGRLRTYVRSDGRPVGGRPWAWSPRAGDVLGGRIGCSLVV